VVLLGGTMPGQNASAADVPELTAATSVNLIHSQGGSVAVSVDRPLRVGDLAGVSVHATVPEDVLAVLLIREQTSEDPPGLLLVPPRESGNPEGLLGQTVAMTIGLAGPLANRVLPPGHYRLYFIGLDVAEKPAPVINHVEVILPFAHTGRQSRSVSGNLHFAWAATWSFGPRPTLLMSHTEITSRWRVLYIGFQYAQHALAEEPNLGCLIQSPGMVEEAQSELPECAAAAPATSRLPTSTWQNGLHVTYATSGPGVQLAKLPGGLSEALSGEVWQIQLALNAS
jgi:hypothetical protein